MDLKPLTDIPDNVRHAGDVIAGLDRCFRVGFGRLGPEQQQALQALQRICSCTPLESPVDAAVTALARNEFVESHFAALAAARAAVQGAQYDALRAVAAAALGRTVADVSAAEPPASPNGAGHIKVWQESTRHWLMELAIAGFAQLDHQALAPFTATLEQLQGEPLLTRLAALLTGFLDELLQAMPIAARPEIPVYRWADLWTRAMIASLRPPLPPTGRKVSGTLSVLGVDIRHHGYFASFDTYALLDKADGPQVVRITLSSYKVDVVHGPEVWQCFGKPAEPMLRAISQHVALKVSDATLLPTGDLLWDGAATVGKPFAWAEVAAKWLAPGANPAPTLPAVAAVDRHPIQLAEPVFFSDYKMEEGDPPAMRFGDGTQLPIAVNRLGNAAELSREDVMKSASLFGLLRFDAGRWSVQPLAIATGGKKPAEEFTGRGALAFTARKKGDTLGVLRERASRLLRKKS